jgi:hypothetical protein
MKKKSVRKRTFPQRDAQLVKIGEMHMQGASQLEIADKFGLSQPQVSRDLKEIYRRMAPTSASEKAKLRARWLAESALMKKKLWAAWNRSTEDKEVQTKKQVALQGANGDAGDGGKSAQKGASERMEASLRSEGQCGNSSFMSELGKCLDREARVNGLNAEELELSGGKPIQFIRVMVREPKQVTSMPQDSATDLPAAVSAQLVEPPLPPGALVIKTKLQSP